jgi:hypothetical protein
MTRYNIIMKMMLFMTAVLLSTSFALAGGHPVAQLNIYGGDVQPPLDQPHGVYVTTDGDVETFAQTVILKVIDHVTKNRRIAIESDLYDTYPGNLVDTTPTAPTCNDQPTMDYNIIKPDGNTLTLIHYFNCHLYIASGTDVTPRAMRLKTLLDGEFALTEFGD